MRGCVYIFPNFPQESANHVRKQEKKNYSSDVQDGISAVYLAHSSLDLEWHNVIVIADTAAFDNINHHPDVLSCL